MAKLAKKYIFEEWGKLEGKTIVRFCTSWDTKDENVEMLLKDISSL